MKHHTINRGRHLLMVGLGILAAGPAAAAPLNLAQVPAGSSARDPAPNIIVSVDDSGSMGWDVNGCVTTDWNFALYGYWQNDPAATIACPPATAANAAANTNPSRMASLRQALFDTFGNTALGTTGLVTDDRIRLSWQTMWDNGRNLRPAGQNAVQNSLTPGSLNTIRPFSGTHRTNFTNFVNSLRPFNGTPSHRMFNNVTTYMGITGVNGPFANLPGTTTAPELSCRRAYHIFMTDGVWNGEVGALGNADGSNRTLGDGTTAYSTTSDQTRVYRDAFGGAIGSLADIAFHNWATDFRSDLTNNIRPLFRTTSNEIIGNVAIEPFWNARNNPMTWQGVTQYTIGFGNPATTWGGNPVWDAATDNNFGGGYSGLVNGTVTWQDLMPGGAANRRPMDLWHAALNGRGTYTPARSPDDLSAAFQTILADILTQTARPSVSIATSSSRASAGGLAYVAGYDSTDNWKGSLAAYRIDSSTSLPSTTPTWRAEALLDAIPSTSLASRAILTHNGTQGVGFNWANLSNNQRLAIQGTQVAGTGSARISYLRGDRTLEGAQGYMRTRSSRLGDIVNSNIWFTDKPKRKLIDLPGHSAFRTANASRIKMVWVGANDGMLHGFNGDTGQEVLAYVPSGLYGTVSNSPLRGLTDPAYTHRYFVDGHPFTGDVNVNTSGAPLWKTLLVGTLGAGGKGYFVLDVTDPTSFANPANADTTVVMDRTATTDADIGHVFVPPVIDSLTGDSQQIVRVNDTGSSGSRWAVIMGNGYNSTNERPVLLIQYLDGTRGIRTIIANATTGQGNGLGSPRTVDLNGNGTVDLVYAGDLRGNLWKFDLTDPNPTQWRVGFSGNPLYTAQDGAGVAQPITAAPIWRVGYDGTGVQVMFGTGRNLAIGDTASTSAQTVYSLWDQSRYSWSSSSPVTGTDGTRITGNRSTALVQQTQNTAATGALFFSTSNNGVPYSRTNTTAPRGWYFDLPVTGERVLNHPTVFERDLIRVSSTVPTSSAEGETCDSSTRRGAGFLSIFNIYSGQPPTHNVFGTDLNDASNGNRVQYGSGESAIVSDPKTNKETLLDPDLTCVGPECPCLGAECQCTGPNCPAIPPGCGGLKGRALEVCGAGLAGRRADWREMR